MNHFIQLEYDTADQHALGEKKRGNSSGQDAVAILQTTAAEARMLQCCRFLRTGHHFLIKIMSYAWLTKTVRCDTPQGEVMTKISPVFYGLLVA